MACKICASDDVKKASVFHKKYDGDIFLVAAIISEPLLQLIFKASEQPNG